MMNPSVIKALEHYNHIEMHSGVEDATPHRLVQILMDGALKKLIAAGVALRSGSVSERCTNIKGATTIIEGLRASLDHERGGVIAQNLDALYSYMVRRLLHANLHADEEALREVHGLLRQIKSGWDAIGTRPRADAAAAAPATIQAAG